MQFLIIIFIILIFMSSIINEASKKSRINDENEFKRLMKNINKARMK
jgi:thioredoxin-related protein